MNALQLNYWLKQHWKLLLVCIVAVLVLANVVFQVVYPSSRLIPGTKVDGVDLGGMKVTDAAKKLDKLYGDDIKLDIYFGDNDAAFQSPKMSEVGIGVNNDARLAEIAYPFYLRFIPTSIWWAPALAKTGTIEYVYDKNKIASYTTSKVGDDCSVPPQNASLKLIDSQLQLVPSATGGKCDITQFQQALADVKPVPGSENKIRIAIDPTPAPVTDDMARDLAAKLNGRLAAAMPISVDASTDEIPGRIVLGWLDFTAVVPEKAIDNSSNQSASLKFGINQKRMEDYLNQGIAAKLIKKPGVSKVSTLDFKETSRVNGADGRGIDLVKTSQSVEDYINNKVQKATGATIVIGPTVVYTRSYSPTSVGFSALLAQYAQDNPGTYSMAFTELSGVAFPRSASYRGDARMPAGGVHSLYLAYTDIMQEAAGIARPVDIIADGKKASTCFADMLQDFDVACRTGFYDYFGHATLTSRAKGIGLTNTVFAGEDTVTSANDLQKVMVGLYKNEVARTEGGQKIVNAIRANSNDEGIPTGIGAGQIGHVIGETETVRNDTAIMFGTSHGAYALTVMTQDAKSWETISNLTKKIQALKAVKIPKDAR